MYFLQYEGFLVPSAQGNCKYFVQLETRAACPVRSAVRVSHDRGDCSISDDSSGIGYNFSPLRAADNSYYTVPSGGNLIKVGDIIIFCICLLRTC